MFLPKENIKDLSTAEHPGMLTIWPGERGQDIKGILKDPIRIGDYPLPWEFHLGMVQNFIAWKGLSEKQINYAMGLNVAVTFSDPSTWPKDRSQWPPDTHSMQLLIVHLGNIGENYRQGVPQLKRTPLNMLDPSPEVYLVYGRGDLSPEATGNWNLAYPWVGPDTAPSGSWSKHAGPADFVIRFRVQVMSPRAVLVGVGYGNHPGWRYRVLDLSRFGRITGIWEIGPSTRSTAGSPKCSPRSCTSTSLPRGWKASSCATGCSASRRPENKALTEAGKLLTTIEPPDPSFQYFLDYAVFYGNGPHEPGTPFRRLQHPRIPGGPEILHRGKCLLRDALQPRLLDRDAVRHERKLGHVPDRRRLRGHRLREEEAARSRSSSPISRPTTRSPGTCGGTSASTTRRGKFIRGSPESKTSPARAAASSTPGPTTHTRS